MVQVLAATLSLFSAPSHAGVYEAPAFTIAQTHDGFEVRDYAPSLQARVRVSGDYEDAWQPGFRVLAGYIFGGTSTGESIAMTVPVAASPARSGDADADADAWTITFTMPSRYSAGTLPRPTDPRVDVVETAGGRWAVRAFSGRATRARADAELRALRTELATAGLTPSGPPVIAQFNPPWIPSWFRHNEVSLPL